MSHAKRRQVCAPSNESVINKDKLSIKQRQKTKLTKRQTCSQAIRQTGRQKKRGEVDAYTKILKISDHRTTDWPSEL